MRVRERDVHKPYSAIGNEKDMFKETATCKMHMERKTRRFFYESKEGEI